MNPGIKQTFLILWIVTLGCVLSTTQALAQEHHHMGHTPAEMNMQFQKPDLDVNEFIRRFETDSREIYAQRRQIVATIGVRPGMAMADIGAGTGLFTWLIAEKVGTEGKVYAVEVAPAFLKYISDQAPARGLDKVVKPVSALKKRRTSHLPRLMWPLFVPRTITSSTRRGSCHRSIRRFDRVGDLCSSTSISARTAAISSGNGRAQRGLFPRNRGSGLWTPRWSIRSA